MSKCPVCSAENDAHTAVFKSEHLKPKPGDVSICIYCASLLTFNEDLTQRLVTDEEFASLPEALQYNIITAKLLARKLHVRS